MGTWLIQVFRRMDAPHWEWVDQRHDGPAGGSRLHAAAAAASICGWHRLEKENNNPKCHRKLTFLCLEKRFFVESFDVSGFISLGLCHPFHLWSAPTVGTSDAALAKKHALVEGTRGTFIGIRYRVS